MPNLVEPKRPPNGSTNNGMDSTTRRFITPEWYTRICSTNAVNSPPHVRSRRFGAGGDLGFGGDSRAQIAQQAVTETVNPTVHRQCLPSPPGIPHHRRLADVHDLLDDVQLAQA